MSRPRARIAMLIQAYLPHIGGAERQLAALAPRLAAQGFEIVILTRRYPGFKPFEKIDGIPIYRLPIPGPKVIASLSFTLSALLHLRKLQPDIIHAHELLSPATTAIAAKRLFKIPVVVKVLRGGVLGDLAKITSRTFSSFRVQQFRRWIDGFLVISKEIDAELAAIGIEEPRRIFVPNGVDTERFSPLSGADKISLRERLGLETDGPIAIFTGRLAPEKRIDVLIQAWNRVQTAIPGGLLLILGAGDERLHLEAIAGPRVRFLGRIEDVAPYLQTANLFILPSATEGLSNALLEAMACGLPPIATKVGGAPDIIAHGKNGWLIPPDNQDALYQQLYEVLEQPELLEKASLKAPQAIIENYALSRTVERLALLYNRLTAAS